MVPLASPEMTYPRNLFTGVPLCKELAEISDADCVGWFARSARSRRSAPRDAAGLRTSLGHDRRGQRVAGGAVGDTRRTLVEAEAGGGGLPDQVVVGLEHDPARCGAGQVREVQLQTQRGVVVGEGLQRLDEVVAGQV